MLMQEFDNEKKLMKKKVEILRFEEKNLDHSIQKGF